MESLPNIVKNFAKLGIAGATIFGIGFAFVTLDPEDPQHGATEATADIGDFSTVQLNKSQRFTSAMAGMGFKPRRFDYNGNLLYFASGYTDMKPRGIMSEVQEVMVEAGVNEKNHTNTRPLQAGYQSAGVLIDPQRRPDKPTKEYHEGFWEVLSGANDGLMNGDLVPSAVSDDHVLMVGVDLDGKHGTIEETIENPQMQKEAPVKSLMGGYRMVEAHWEEDARASAITAVWTGDDFDPDRMLGPGDSPADPDVPACIGCQRDFRVRSLEKDEPFQSNMWYGLGSVDRTYDFYVDTMKQRGWREAGVQPKLERIEPYMPELREANQLGRLLSMEKDGQTMNVTILPSEDGKVHVISNHQHSAAQGIAPDLSNKLKAAHDE